MLPPILVNDGAQEGPRPSDWALLAEPMPQWVPPFGGGLAGLLPLNLPSVDPSLALSTGAEHINGFNPGSWLPGQDTNGYLIDQQHHNEPAALLNPLKRKFSAVAQKWHNRNQHGEYHLAEGNGDSLNIQRSDGQISQRPVNLLNPKVSAAAQEWNSRKNTGEFSSALDELMQYRGLEEVKQHFLDIKSKVDICDKQDPDRRMNVLKLERFNAVFQGNPGTGAHAVISACCFLVRLTYVSCERQDDGRSIIR